ncbi:MAG TPA: hypothetical protein DD381_10075 [Lentisphaeria bacterium]|nr:MAG: hypothetical protein A2X47_11850 [Lentisphaerae bacterium GWF2_38_69]HBM16671.1 hypothetical protein [Lentisphaeria bacterium]
MGFIKNYPKGVISLSSIECFERFGFYATQGILVLYAAASLTKGGLGWSDADALRLTGIFSAVVYATPLVGGWLSDRFLGRKNGLILGNILLLLGYICMMHHGSYYLFSALTLVAIGTGFLKPTISAMVGEFYDASEDASRDAGFAIFYASINIGGFFGPLVSGLLAETAGYSFAFGSSAVGMTIALVNTIVSSRLSLKNVGNKAKTYDKNGQVIVKESWTTEETKRFWVYIGLCISNIVWNIFYVLPYGLLNLWADDNVNRNLLGWTIPTAWYYASYGLLIVIFSPVIARIYKMLQERNKAFTLSYKLAVAYLLMGLGCLFLMPFVIQLAHSAQYKGNMLYLIVFYAIFAFSELLTLPVMLSAATKFSPKGFSATMIALNMLISWCIGAWIGGEVSALTESISPIIVFISMIAACVLFFFIHIFTNKFIEKFCDTSSLT